MFKKVYAVALMILIVAFGCKKDKSKVKEENVLKDSIQKVEITVHSDDSVVLQSLNLLDYSKFFGSDEDVESRIGKGDSLQILLDSISKPQIMEIMAFGNHINHTRIFVTPGDTIAIKIKNGKFEFDGKNADHYAFYHQLDSIDFQWTKIGYEGDIYEYKRKSDSLYKSNVAFFNEYLKAHPNVSEDFKKSVAAELKFEYLYNLMNPRIRHDESTVYINSMEGLANVIASDSRIAEGKLLNLQDYFGDIKITEFNNPEFINNDYFKRSLIDFIRQYFKESEYLDYTVESFDTEKQFIDNNLDGEIQAYAKGRLISDYYKKGFGSDELTKKVLQNAISEYKNQHLKPSYRARIETIEDELRIANSTFNLSELREKLVDINGKSTGLKNVFEKEQGRIKVVDIWASWCGPCIKDIKDASAFKSRLRREKNVAFVHLSIDQNAEKWLKASKDLQEFLPFEHQYLFENYINSSFLSSMKVLEGGKVSVPRYIIINSKHQVILNNAPAPSDSIAFEAIIDKIK